MNAQGNYARQSEILDNKECKNEGGTQRWLFIIAKRWNKWHLIIGGRENQWIPIYCHTRAVSVHEPLDNDGGWANSQAWRAFWGHVNGFLNHPVFTHWTFELAICPLDSLICPRELSTNQGGANVRPCHIQTHLGLGLQPDDMAHTVPKPRPHTGFRPIEQMIFINSCHATPLRSHPVTCLPNKKVIARLYHLSIAQ